MISFTTDNQKFNYRVAAVCVHNGRVLLHRAEHDNFWTLPGGRVEMREVAAVALARELQEEIGVNVTVGRPLWFVENFFEYGGMPYHELGFYYHVELPADCPYLEATEFYGSEPGLVLIYRWFDFEELGGYTILPSFLAEGVRQLPESLVHLVHYDGVMK